VREELFGIERLEQHAASLAAAQPVTANPGKVLSLSIRLNDNAAVLLAVYRRSAAELEAGRDVVPAAEWLLDNYHLVEEHIREIRADLPPGYYRQLPKLAEGPFAGYPRVFGIAWAFVAHTDSHFDPLTLQRFIAAYQRVEPLTIGELWAVAITLRIVLIENLRRLAEQIATGGDARGDADALADRLLAAGNARSALDTDIATRSSEPLSEQFAVQMAKRLRDQDPRTTPALGWLEDRLRRQGTSIDDVVRSVQQRQGVSNLTVRNIITSLRLISDIDWATLFESVSLVDARFSAGSDFAAMDFATRNLYRSAIEQLARGSTKSEMEIAELALNESHMAADRTGDPGYHLIAEGRRAFEQRIGFRPPLRLRINRLNIHLGLGGYLGAILLTMASLLGLAAWALAASGLGGGLTLLFASVACIPAIGPATALVNRAITSCFGAMTLPGLELAAGVPSSSRTLIAVPTLLTSEAALLEQIEGLEVHHLAGAGGDLTFALLSDGLDADQEVVPGDAALLHAASKAIADLNRRYAPGPAGGSRFLLLHRRRVFNPGENKWMGWERKRGKLHELNRLLRGATDTTFVPVDGLAPQVPRDVRYVITLDGDTKLPRDAALRLIGKMAHPLNRPRFDEQQQRVVNGHAIMQPRVTPSLPIGREGSLYQRVFSGPGGIDPYAGAVSDVYQDLFGEGSYTGKGIYHVDAFEAALAGRILENTLLSHDLFEGIFARAALATDVEVIEEFPSRYDVVARRQHRWMRGDWQLLPWILGRRHRGRTVPSIGRWKMLDNLIRSLSAPLLLIAFGLCLLFPLPAAATGALVLLATIAIPSFLPAVFSLLPRHINVRFRSHMQNLGTDFRLAARQTVLSTVFLADQAWRTGDAVIRTLVRLFSTRRHLLEWTTAAQAAGKPRLDLAASYRDMAGGTLVGSLLALLAAAVAPSSWLVCLLFAGAWLAAPAVALWVSRAPADGQQRVASETDANELRLIARRTWRFFETFVTPEDNMLPPDNFQEDPKPVLAHRTSPTNIGLYLLSAIAARDFGWTGTLETIERIEATLQTLRKLPRFMGHFYNWYGTRDLQALAPAYVSSVDSGNLAGHLIAVANACEEWRGMPQMPATRQGVADTALLVREALAAQPVAGGSSRTTLSRILDEIDVQLTRGQANNILLPTLMRLAAKAAREVKTASGDDPSPDLAFWIEALRKCVVEHDRDRIQTGTLQKHLDDRLTGIAALARETAMAMDFAFLLDRDRKLLSIGYSAVDRRLDPSCYDLLASEARLASLFAIAKGDVSSRHWFRLGRSATPVGGGSALISWSGSMFEYLMPSLVMRAPLFSLLEQTNRLIVKRQQAYGGGLGIPWGVSESAYNARDIEFTYQYSNFGVPGLGLKRGLSENIVIAPYATGLASMVDPHAARLNYARLAAIGSRGRYGFYEAVDFTPSRLPQGEAGAVVHCFMAHHQGMTIVAIANTLQDGRMRARFHREPMIQASELLLQERLPRDVAVAHPRAEEVKIAAASEGKETRAERRFLAPNFGAPMTHLLSNGRYAVMLTTAGAGYSRWRDLAITRWHEDSTRDNWGHFFYFKDVQNGEVWSAGMQPAGRSADHSEITFGEDHATFIRRDGSLTTSMEVMVSGEDDGEVRRVTLTNNGRRSREIEITSYSELVLTTPAADTAHPAFAKLFVETEYLPEYGALIATRRRRAPDEPTVWAAQFAVVEGKVLGDPQYESDRARFLGRGGTVAAPIAMTGDRKLSDTAGTVLDPIFSLRQRIGIPAGGTGRIDFWTVVASSRALLLDLIDKHHDRNAFDRAKTLAWTQAQVQLRHLDIKSDEVVDFQTLAAAILYADPRFRPSSEIIIRGAGPQSALWPHAISGDLPIVLLRIDDVEDMPQVRQLLRAHEYWRMKRLAVDLVIINERSTSYLQDLQSAIETAVRSNQARPRAGDELAQGAVTLLRADLMSVEARALLQSVARVALVARRGTIAEQVARLPQSMDRRPPVVSREPVMPNVAVAAAPAPGDLEFFNGLGGFTENGQEYVTILQGGTATPAPWINVIANPGFGFQVATDGGGYTWSENSRENQLTPWSNDPTADPAGEAIYLRDEATGAVWSPTAQPINDDGAYLARHGFGYSRFEHEANGIAADLLQFVPLTDPIKISRLTLRNASGRARRLSVTGFAEWVLGTSRAASGPFVVTEIDRATGAMLARNPWSIAFPGRIAFADLRGQQTAWTADRTEFLGRHGGPDAPDALLGKSALSGATGAGLDPCTALQCTVELGAGETAEIVWLIGHSGSVEAARDLIGRYRAMDLDVALRAVTDHWKSLLGTVQVKTPDRTMDIMLNGWLLYQAVACRLWARSAFYQASGAYGFRDQLQDGMALTFARPAETRAHLLRAAGRQFVEGDVQHWWLPQSGQGVRTRISDDRAWLAFATASYIAASGDGAVLDEIVPFIEGPALLSGQHDAFFQPMVSDQSATLFEHCARGLDQALTLIGEDGLPLMGTGDWNDGMNRVGEGGKGESVWLGWLLLRSNALFAPLAEARDPDRARRWLAQAAVMRDAIEREAWDGEWYRRATFDDGTWLGSKHSEECRIDSIAQSWAVLSEAGDPGRAATAMASLEKLLIRTDAGIAPLFTPPFDRTERDPGYIKGYPPGLRENGGQYSHAAMWAVLAFAKLGQGDRAHALFSLLNPINHTLTAADADRYKVEPYVVAADVYSVAPHIGRGGWTWYTGSAAWMYRAGIEGILGIRREGKFVTVEPCIPAAWPSFAATINLDSTRFDISVVRQSVESVRAKLDGVPIDCDTGKVRVLLDGRVHNLSIEVAQAVPGMSSRNRDDDADSRSAI
jgi:cyclic beta-1,2-glucan synthetase